MIDTLTLMAELEIKPTAAAKVRVAAVVLLGAAITGTLVFLLSGGGRDSFAAKAYITTFMPDSTGLARNSEVRLSGIQIGRVTKIEISGYLDPQRAVRVDMKVIARYLRSIPQDSQTSVGSDTLVGYRFVDIAEGKAPAWLADRGVLKSEPLKQASDRADLVEAFQDRLRQADAMLIQISSGQTQIGHFVMGDREYNNVMRQVGGFERTMRAFADRGSAVGSAFFTTGVYDRLHDPVKRLDDALAAIQRGEGAGGRLFASDEQYVNLVRNLREFRKVLAEANAGDGRFGALLQDDEAYSKVRKMLASTDAMLNSLNAGETRTGQLLRDRQLYESLAGALRSMQEMLQDFRTNPKKYLRYKVF